MVRRHGHGSLKAALARREGATALEFGLIAAILCLLLFGAFEVSRYYYTYQAVRTVVAEAARRVQIDATLGAGGTQVCQTGTAIDVNVRDRIALNPNGLTVCYTRSTNTTGVVTVVVTGSYGFQFTDIGVMRTLFGTSTYTMTERTQTAY